LSAPSDEEATLPLFSSKEAKILSTKLLADRGAFWLAITESQLPASK
jgi:hypothetical protein